MLMALLLAQAASLPDIEIKAQVQARSLTFEKRGHADLTIRAEPEGANIVEVHAPRASGRKTIRNVAVSVSAEARIAEPPLNVSSTATPPNDVQRP